MQTREQHNATTYRRIWIRPFHPQFFPDNIVSARPIRFMGHCIGYKMTLAKPDYPWTCSCGYCKQIDATCRAKIHDTYNDPAL